MTLREAQLEAIHIVKTYPDAQPHICRVEKLVRGRWVASDDGYVVRYAHELLAVAEGFRIVVVV